MFFGQFLSQSYNSLDLTSEVKLSSCDSKLNTDYLHKVRLISKKMINDTLNLKIGIVNNCDFTPKVQHLKKSDSLYLSIKNVSQITAACNCYYELELKIPEIKDTNFITFLENRELIYSVNKYIFPRPDEFENSQKYNQFSANGEKKGLWIVYHKNSNQIKTRIFYELNKSGNSQVKWYVNYTIDNQIIEICTVEQKVNSTEFSNICINYKEYLKLFLLE